MIDKNPRPAKRLFWLGMHKVLTKTELPRLRQIGYEVFNPPYLSTTYDQSANMEWDREQPSTLPAEVFQRLSQYNFFYNQIEPEIAELLNAYFDAVLVTISPHWLEPVLKAFRKKIIYRTYGQTYQICAHLAGLRLFERLLEGSDFYFLPFAEETLLGEHRWLTNRCRVVPYSLSDDIYGYENTWEHTEHNGEIMVNVPNINHPYYNAMYQHLNTHFAARYLRMYGVQPRKMDDIRVAGTLERKELLRAYQKASGFFYPYHDYNVCYLQPIEMMTIGGPVVFAQGSLLERMMNGNFPGLARGIQQQQFAMERLRRGDRVYIGEVIASQAEIVRRYHPDHVYPVFDRVFRELLEEPEKPAAFSSDADNVIRACRTEAPSREVWLLCHWPGDLICEHVPTGSMYPLDGISHVITKVIAALLEHTSYTLVISCYAYQAPRMASFYYDVLSSGRMRLYVLDAHNMRESGKADTDEVSWNEVFRFLQERAFPAGSAEASQAGTVADRAFGRKELAEVINRREQAAAVFVPHYYHFPEARRLKRQIVFYVPDYMPHFYPGVHFEGTLERDQENAHVGREIAKRSRAVLTNSEFTKSYLPDSSLQVSPDKIRVAPMPLLAGALPGLNDNERVDLEQLLVPRRFLFYPTANRPNKELAFLLHVFQELRSEQPDLKLALTCSLSSYPPVEETARALGLSAGGLSTDDIVLFQGAHEGTLRWLYENALALSFTSTMEGNFPPQIIEALHYDTPVVATRLPQIEEVLKEECDSLLLCSPKSIADFVNGLGIVARSFELVLSGQLFAKRKVLDWNNTGRFNRTIAAIFSEAAGDYESANELSSAFSYSDRYLEYGLLARVKKVLAESPSDYQFSHHLHDLVLKRSSTRETVNAHTQYLRLRGSREQLLLDVISRSDFKWPDAGELEYVREWLSAGLSEANAVNGGFSERFLSS
jgi:glycosyltransferase involved in cell wall biosynthesis